MILKVIVLAGLVVASVATTAFAQQTQTYSYDVHGRLASTTRTTGASNLSTTYTLDKADNRTSRAISTASTMLASDPLASTPDTSDSFDAQRSNPEAHDKNVLPEAVPVPSANEERGDEL